MEQDFLARAREGVKKAMSKRDALLTHVVGSIDDGNKAANLLLERLTEWYWVYFPEVRISEPDKFCKAVEILDRENVDVAALSEIVGEKKANEIAERAKRSMGAEVAPEDVEMMKTFARKLNELYDLRIEMEAYMEKLGQEICPNLSYLVSPKLAARLVAKAGSLHRLATMPASTVQVLGAEKALFKHLKKKTKPPKHGLIFQHPAISMAPKNKRGKIARAIAGKIAIAVKADAYTGRFIAPKLKEDLDRRLKEIG
ncbi:MAG: hypothetical protein NT157_01350 [Candidatus Micrarchaeota archaeon]|nr:hypothetical protein [Candidatus Micrarchaeota archaeon]